MNKSSSKNFQPGLQSNNEQKADGSHVSPAISNAVVIGSQDNLSCFGRDLEDPFIKKYFMSKPIVNLKEESVLQSLRFP